MADRIPPIPPALPSTSVLTLCEQAVRLESQLTWMISQSQSLLEWAGSVRRQLEELQAEIDAAEEVEAYAMGERR
jgi:hypothetical protein